MNGSLRAIANRCAKSGTNSGWLSDGMQVTRKQWPVKDMFTYHQFEKRNIPIEMQASEGRALSLWRDAGWGQLVASGKYQSNRFADELVTACVGD
jgi:ATP-dependent DNA helicase RecQ